MRWRILVVSIVLASTLGAVAAASAAADPGACGPSTVHWTGAAGDGLWSSTANWQDADGVSRGPSLADVVCLDTRLAPASGVEVDQAVAVGSLTVIGGPDAPAVHVPNELLAADAETFNAPLVLEGPGHPVVEVPSGPLTLLSTTTVAPSAGGATLRGSSIALGTGAFGDPIDPAAALDVSHDLQVDGPFTLHGTMAVHAPSHVWLSDPVADRTTPEPFEWDGALVVEAGAAVSNVDPLTISTGLFAFRAGTQPDLQDVRFAHLDGRFRLEAHGDTTVERIAPGATLAVLPAADGHQSISGSPGILVGGTLTGAGSFDHRLAVDASVLAIDPSGTVDLAGATVTARVQNAGTLRSTGAVDAQLPTGTTAPHVSTGRLELVDDGGPDSREYVAFGGGLTLSGQASGPAPTRLVVNGPLDATGRYDVALYAIYARIAHPGYSTTSFREVDYENSELVSDAGGLAAEQGDHAVSTGTAKAFEMTGTIRLAPGYVPCPGSRFRLAQWSTLNPNIQGGVAAVEGGPAWMDAYLTPAQNAVDLVVRGTPTGTCDGTPEQRWVAAAYLVGLSRSVDSTALTAWSSHATTAAQKRASAAAILGSSEGRRAAVTAEYQRILGPSPDAAGLAYWSSQVSHGQSLDRLRATLYGSAAFGRKAGTGDLAWAQLLYRTELRRALDPAGQKWVKARLDAGATRSRVALELLDLPEADRALVGRWWAAAFGDYGSSSQLSGPAAALGTGASEASVEAGILSMPAFTAS